MHSWVCVLIVSAQSIRQAGNVFNVAVSQELRLQSQPSAFAEEVESNSTIPLLPVTLKLFIYGVLTNNELISV